MTMCAKTDLNVAAGSVLKIIGAPFPLGEPLECREQQAQANELMLGAQMAKIPLNTEQAQKFKK